MRVSTLIRWLFRFTLTGGVLYGILTFFPPTYWPWRWMDFFQKPGRSCVPDTNFVIIDVGQLSRPEIAWLLQKVAAQKPRVIVMDLYFAFRQDPVQDSLLREVLCQVAATFPLYLPSDIEEATKPQDKPSTPASDPFFATCTRKAFANLLYQESTGGRIVRYARLYHKSSAGTEPSLAWAAALHLDSTRIASLTLPPTPPIQYRGNIPCFYFLIGKDLLSDTLPIPILSEKAVFIGFADPLYKYTEDLFFSPLGVRPLTLTTPDMYGVVIHANIASMIYHQTFWKEVHLGFLYLTVGLSLILLGILADAGLRNVYLWVRLAQIALILILAFLFAFLARHGYWVDAEVAFLGLFISGETCLLTVPRRSTLA